MIRFNALALALAFGVAKAVVTASTMAPLSWMMRDTFLSHLPILPGMSNDFILTNVLWNFVGGVIAGGLFAVIYNKIADASIKRSA